MGLLYLGIIVYGMAVSGMVLAWMWFWFMVPIFHLPVLSIPQAIGISMVVSFVTKNFEIDETPPDAKKAFKAFYHGTLKYAVTFAMAYIVHYIIEHFV